MVSFRPLFRYYTLGSISLVVGLLGFIAAVNESLFQAILYLCTARFSVAVLSNFVLMQSIFATWSLLRLFLGELRELEIEQVFDSGRGFLMDTVMFLVLSSPTIGGSEVTAVGLLHYVGFVVVLKIFHLISQIRIAHLFEMAVPAPHTLARLVSLMVLLLTVDSFSIYYFYQSFSGRSSLYLWLLFECLGMLTSATSNFLKFIMHYIDSRLDNGWAGKNAYIFFLDVVSDIIELLIFLVFMIMFVITYPTRLPIHMTSDIIQVVRTLFLKLRSFQRYRQLIKEMSKRFPVATFEELENADTCIICRDVLHEGARRLPCSHIFHMECLKAWFVQQQSCPTCRSDIFSASSSTAAASSSARGAGPREANGDNQAGAAAPADAAVPAMGAGESHARQEGARFSGATGVASVSEASALFAVRGAPREPAGEASPPQAESQLSATLSRSGAADSKSSWRALLRESWLKRFEGTSEATAVMNQHQANKVSRVRVSSASGVMLTLRPRRRRMLIGSAATADPRAPHCRKALVARRCSNAAVQVPRSCRYRAAIWSSAERTAARDRARRSGKLPSTATQSNSAGCEASAASGSQLGDGSFRNRGATVLNFVAGQLWQYLCPAWIRAADSLTEDARYQPEQDYHANNSTCFRNRTARHGRNHRTLPPAEPPIQRGSPFGWRRAALTLWPQSWLPLRAQRPRLGHAASNHRSTYSHDLAICRSCHCCCACGSRSSLLGDNTDALRLLRLIEKEIASSRALQEASLQWFSQLLAMCTDSNSCNNSTAAPPADIT